MIEFQIVEATWIHAVQMGRLLRSCHKAVNTRLGLDSRKELRAWFRRSTISKAWLVDGHLMGMGGIIGELASSTGFVWIAVSDEVSRFPVAMVKEVKRQMLALLETRTDIVTMVADDDPAARRFIEFIGFRTANFPVPEGFTAMKMEKSWVA